MKRSNGLLMIIVIELNIITMISRWPDLAHVHLPGKHVRSPGAREAYKARFMLCRDGRITPAEDAGCYWRLKASLIEEKSSRWKS